MSAEHSYTLVRCEQNGIAASTAQHRESWRSEVFLGGPPVTPAMHAALRRRTHTSHHDDPVQWNDQEGWDAVTDLHQAGQHDDALDLAKFLWWCDARRDRYTRGYWTILRHELAAPQTAGAR